MQITTITYRRLVSHSGRYGHDAFEATATISDGEDAAVCADQLMAFVHGQLGLQQAVEMLSDQERSLKRSVERLSEERAELQADVNAAEKVLDKFGELRTLAQQAGLTGAVEALAVADQRVPF